jgi:hypothetical protein
MSKPDDGSWLEHVAHKLAAETGIPLDEARREVHEAEQRAVDSGQVIDISGVRWAVRPSSLRLAEAEGDELTAMRLQRALARLQREGKEFG